MIDTRRGSWCLTALFAATSLLCVLRAQDRPPAFRSEAHLVVVQVAVLDKHSMLVPNLTQQQFRLYEDGVRQDIQFFVSEDRPVAVGLVVDNSTSMQSKRDAIAVAGDAFAQSSHPDDALFTMNFNEAAWLGLPDGIAFTSDRAVLHDALAALQSRGMTAMYDGISAALDHVATSPLERRVLIVVSDGGDTASHLRLAHLLDKVRRSETVIYTVGVFDELRGGDKNALRAVAAASGGALFLPRDSHAVRADLERIARDIRQCYSIGYVSTNARQDGTYRKISVVALDSKSQQPLTVRVRDGYRAASDPDRR